MRAIAGNRWGASKKVLLVVYMGFNTLHLRIWRCCARFYEQLNKRNLDTVQAEAFRIACGAARGTSTAAIQVDTEEPPLQLRRLQPVAYLGFHKEGKCSPPSHFPLISFHSTPPFPRLESIGPLKSS